MFAFGFQIIGLIVMVTTKVFPFIYIYAACLGIGWGSILTALPNFVGNNYPRDIYARVMGIVFPFQVLSQAISATAAGLVYDRTGQYTAVFIALIGFASLGLVSVMLARGRQPQPAA